MSGARAYPCAIRRRHEIATSAGPAALGDWLADEFVFASPVVHTPQRGKPIAKAYLAAAAPVPGGSLRHVDSWRAEVSAVLEFVAILDGIEVNGSSPDDRIVGFKVVARPSNGIEVLRAKMAERPEAIRKG